MLATPPEIITRRRASGRLDHSWPDEHVAVMLRLWRDGESASSIAKILGERFGLFRSRCSVLGKLRRMSAPPRVTPPRMSAKRARPPRLKVPKNEPSPFLIDGALVDVQRLGAGMCRFPVGEPRAPDFHFCAQPIERGGMCAFHYRLCYQSDGVAS
jgi:GcrA cell cycle regulator